MARRGKEMNKDEEDEEEGGGTEHPWGTLEELLLACAVNRHGAKSWDSIAMELQSRTSHHHRHLHRRAAVYSPPNCKQRYRDLRRRFAAVDGCDMVDELRRLRVAELRREVKRRDVSIEFLQSKVKRLEEEREQREEAKQDEEEEGTDLRDEPEERESEANSPAEGRSIAGDDNRSFNESNSTSNQKGENREHSGHEPGLKHEPDEPEGGGTEPEREEQEPAHTESKPVRNGEVGSSRGKKRRRRSCFQIASSSGGEDEPEGGTVISAKDIAIKSKPLIDILVMLRSHKNGSLFDRRLRSQVTEKYKKTIRQPMDLQTVQSRVDRGFYLNNSLHKFFRDLLLLLTNAIVFFPNTSPHHIAAIELRQLVTKQMTKTIPTPPRPDPEPKQTDPVGIKVDKPLAKLKQAGNKTVPPRPDPGKKKPNQLPDPDKKQHSKRILTGNKALEEKSTKQQMGRRSGRVGSGDLKRTKRKSPPKEVAEESSDDDNDDDAETEKENTKRREKQGERDQGSKGGNNGGGKRGRPAKMSPVRRDLRRDGGGGGGGRGKRGREGGGDRPEVVAAADSGRSRKRSRR